MPKSVLAGIVSILRGRAPRSGYQGPPGQQPSGEVACAVLTCPRCGRQRPYPVSDEEFAAGHESSRLEQGIGLHLSIRHDLDGVDRDELTDRAVAAAEVKGIPEAVVDEVERRDRKWREYDL